MAIINFKEIPEAHGNGENGLRDTFELFAEVFFTKLGFKIIEGPSRGTDNGKDLIIEESVQGKFDVSESKIRWLVSCKHKAHTGNSVRPEDEGNLLDRLSLHQCSGFIGFYSTLASTGLNALISGLPNSGKKIKILNAENIETLLLQSQTGIELIERFFPQSFAQWRAENPEKAKIFKDGEFELNCMVCGKDLITNNSVQGGFYTIKEMNNLDKIVSVKWSCIGECDKRLNSNNYRKGLTEIFEHIESKATPVTYLIFILDILRDMQNGRITYSEDAFEKMKHLICAIYPLVTRNMTKKEAEILEGELMMRSIG